MKKVSLGRWYQLASIPIVILVVFSYRYYVANLAGPPSGRTPQGICFGVLGFTAMMITLLYSARRRFLTTAMRPMRVNHQKRVDIKEREQNGKDQLQQLRREVINNSAMNPRIVRQRAKGILKDNKLRLRFRIRVIKNPGQAVRLSIERREWIGRLEIWYYWHLMLGCLSALLILAHAGFRFQGNIVAIGAFVFLIGVVLTGIWGYYLYKVVPPVLTKVEDRVNRTPEELTAELERINNDLEEVTSKAESLRAIYRQESAISGVHLTPSWRWLYGAAEIARDPSRPDRLESIVKKVPEKNQADLRKMMRLIFDKEKVEISLYPQLRYEYLLKVWLNVHIPLAAGLMVLSLIHILLIIYY